MFGRQVEGPTVVGEGAVIVGSLTATGRVQIDGVVEGSVVVQGQVSVGPKGRVVGDLVADEVAVGGEVQGRVVARAHLHVVASGKIRGDAHYDTLQVDKGALLEGRTLHGEPALDVSGEVQDVGSEPVLLRPSQRPAAVAS